MLLPPVDEAERCMQEALVGVEVGSGREGGAGEGEMGAGLQMDDTGAEVDVEEDEEEEEGAEVEMAGGVNWPLLSDPVLSLVGDDFFFMGFALELLLLCSC